MDHTKKPLTALSICPGILGLERGITRAIGELQVLTYVEIETFIIENLIAGMESGVLAPALIWSDLKTFDARPYAGKIDILLGGYPCQPFSTAGQRKGINDSRHLWPYISDIIEIARPTVCFFENVSGHLQLGYREVRQSLEAKGYRVKEGIFSAEEVGAPHKRERLFILAILANSHSNGSGTDARSLIEKSNETKSTSQREEWQVTFRKRLRHVAGYCDNKLAHTHSARQPKQRNDRKPSFEKDARISYTNPFFPAGQGFYQHVWEEPRTIESGLGCAAYGYNFREDLLRALGNSVVEQTAELAFITLLNEHYADHN